MNNFENFCKKWLGILGKIVGKCGKIVVRQEKIMRGIWKKNSEKLENWWEFWDKYVGNWEKGRENCGEMWKNFYEMYK